jgi:ABC-type microcin C transport system permease subunit YejE
MPEANNSVGAEALGRDLFAVSAIGTRQSSLLTGS